MIRRTLNNHPSTSIETQRENIFHTRCNVLENICSLIVDSGCTVPYPGVDKVKVRVNVGVKVNIRRRLGEATPSACIAEAGRRQEGALPR